MADDDVPWPPLVVPEVGVAECCDNAAAASVAESTIGWRLLTACDSVIKFTVALKVVPCAAAATRVDDEGLSRAAAVIVAGAAGNKEGNPVAASPRGWSRGESRRRWSSLNASSQRSSVWARRGDDSSRFPAADL